MSDTTVYSDQARSYVDLPHPHKALLRGAFGFRETGYLLVVPIFSGYRYDVTQKLVLTTNYARVIGDIAQSTGAEHADQLVDQFKIAIPIRDGMFLQQESLILMSIMNISSRSENAGSHLPVSRSNRYPKRDSSRDLEYQCSGNSVPD